MVRDRAEVFERFGEKDYREGERRLVARLIDGSVRVIATGGGVFVDPQTRRLLKERAITVWLDAPVDVLATRTSRRDTRPLLRNGDPRHTLERLAGEAGLLVQAPRDQAVETEGVVTATIEPTVGAGGTAVEMSELADRLLEHLAYRGDETRQPFLRHFARCLARVDPRSPQRFADIYVAQARHDSLVEQQQLDRLLPTGEGLLDMRRKGAVTIAQDAATRRADAATSRVPP